MKEYHKRSIIKAISYRFAGTFITALIVFIFTQKLSLAISIASVETVVKIIIYYLHERAWNRMHWGKVKNDNETD